MMNRACHTILPQAKQSKQSTGGFSSAACKSFGNRVCNLSILINELNGLKQFFTQKSCMRMNRQIDAAEEQPPFDLKRLLRFGPDNLFSMLTPPRFHDGREPLQRFDHFDGFQNAFLRMIHQIDAGERPSFDQKRTLHGLGIPFSALTQPSLSQPMRASLLTPLQRIMILLSFNQSS
jgi:hypothetical protein